MLIKYVLIAGKHLETLWTNFNRITYATGPMLIQAPMKKGWTTIE